MVSFSLRSTVSVSDDEEAPLSTDGRDVQRSVKARSELQTPRVASVL